MDNYRTLLYKNTLNTDRNIPWNKRDYFTSS